MSEKIFLEKEYLIELGIARWVKRVHSDERKCGKMILRIRDFLGYTVYTLPGAGAARRFSERVQAEILSCGWAYKSRSFTMWNGYVMYLEY